MYSMNVFLCLNIKLGINLCRIEEYICSINLSASKATSWKTNVLLFMTQKLFFLCNYILRCETSSSCIPGCITYSRVFRDFLTQIHVSFWKYVILHFTINLFNSKIKSWLILLFPIDLCCLFVVFFQLKNIVTKSKIHDLRNPHI